jgi:hypothetical protein
MRHAQIIVWAAWEFFKPGYIGDGVITGFNPILETVKIGNAKISPLSCVNDPIDTSK